MAEGHKDIGNNLFRQHRFEEAVVAYTNGLNCPCDAQLRAILLSNRSACHLALHSLAQGLADAQESIAVCPTYIKGFARAGACLEKMPGRKRDAIKMYEQAVELPLSAKRLVALQTPRVLTECGVSGLEKGSVESWCLARQTRVDMRDTFWNSFAKQERIEARLGKRSVSHSVQERILHIISHFDGVEIFNGPPFPVNFRGSSALLRSKEDESVSILMSIAGMSLSEKSVMTLSDFETDSGEDADVPIVPVIFHIGTPATRALTEEWIQEEDGDKMMGALLVRECF